MKQILMSKEEYDQLTAELETLKNEKKQLSEDNSNLNKEVVKLKQIVEREKGNDLMFLNQITTRTYTIDRDCFINRLKDKAKIYFYEYAAQNRYLEVRMEPTLDFIESIDDMFINTCMKPEEKETYGYCVSEQLLHGSLLQMKMKEVIKLKSFIDEQKTDYDKLKSQYLVLEKEKEDALKQFFDKRLECKNKTQEIRELQRVARDCNLYKEQLEKESKENKEITDEILSLSLKLKKYEEREKDLKDRCVVLPKWAMQIMKRIKRDKKNE